jgi:signal transduction histidine kinase
MTSLRRGLTWSLGLGLSVLFLVQWLVISLAFRAAAENYLVSRLESDAEALLAALEVDRDGQLRLDPVRLDPAFQRVFSGRYFVIGDEAATLRSRSLWDADLPVPRLETGAQERLRAPGPQSQQLLVLTSTYRVRGHAVAIAVAEDVSALAASLRRFQVAYGSASLVVLVLLVVLQRAVINRTLLPLERVREELRRLHQGQIRRIEARAPSEIAPLVSELNGLLDVLGERLRRSREALGNLAHALKTHLAVFTHVLEEPEAQAQPAVREALQGPVSAMSRLVERELKRARLAGGRVPGERVSLAGAVADLVEALQKIHADKGVRFEVDIPSSLTFEGDREDLLELAGNLVDNACKWCERSVRISASGGAELVLTVEDDGPGAHPDGLSLLTQRGMRVDDSKPGSGLGLAIAAEVARSYGGALRFGQSAVLGGLRVEAVLSAALPSDL